MSTPSKRPKRWFDAPPARTASFESPRIPGPSCACRGRGSRVPRTASAARAASVAMPQVRCTMFSAVRSPTSSVRSPAETLPMTARAGDARALGFGEAHLGAGLEPGEDPGEGARPGEDQRLLRPDLRPAPGLLGDERLGGDVTRRPEVLLQRQVNQTVDEVHAPEVRPTA